MFDQWWNHWRPTKTARHADYVKVRTQADVLPDIGGYTGDGAPAHALLDDPALRPQLLAWFDVIRHELADKLGPATTP